MGSARVLLWRRHPARVALLICGLFAAATPSRAQSGGESGSLDNLVASARAALEAGRPAEARELLDGATLATGAAPVRAEALLVLARAHRALGDLAAPERLYREADAVLRADGGAESAAYARFQYEVGRYYHTRRKYDLAERYYLQAFRLRVRLLGEEHVETAESLNGLAVLFENQARFDKAENYYRHALALRRKLLGDDHERTVETLEHFARFLYRSGRSAEAEAPAAEARAARRRLLDRAAAERAPLDFPAENGRDYRPPELASRTEPDYTEEARIGRHEGAVGLEVEIDADGAPRNVAVTRILGLGLDEKAMEAVRQWRFKPARAQGRRVPSRLRLEIEFSLL